MPGRPASVEMALYRMVIGFDDGVPRATYDLARGASEQPDDRHFGDLHTLRIPVAEAIRRVRWVWTPS